MPNLSQPNPGLRLAWSPCIQVIGRDTFLIGGHRVVDYECVRRTLMSGAVPQLTVVEAEAISIERSPETVYFNLRESLARMSRDSRDGEANGGDDFRQRWV